MNVRTLGDRYWEEILRLNPLLATQVGDERFDDRLPDPAPHGVERRRKAHAAALRDARRLCDGATDPWDRAICDTVEAIAGPEVAGIDLGLYHLAPIDHLWGPGTLLEQIGSIQRVDDDDQASRYLRRLEALAGYLDATGELLLKPPPAPRAPVLIVDRCIRQVEQVLGTSPEHSPVLRPFAHDEAPARSLAVNVLRSKTLPAYARYLMALRAYREYARDTLGLMHVPGGLEMYRVCVERWTSLSLDPQEVHDMGRSDLEQIQGERLALAGRLGATDPEAAIAEYVAAGRNRFASREDILRHAEEQVARGWDRAKSSFGRLPARNCEVRAVDPSREADVLEYYLPPSADGSRPGIYYVNTANPHDRPRHSMASTSFHEANPGHHLQMALEREQQDRPALLRFGGELAGSAFVEGWGLYSERLADEMDLYLDDYERLGMLELQAFRAARLVVDTGLHAFGWSRDQSIDVLRSTGLDPHRAALETDRYVAMPGQALAYKVGQIEIEASRRRAERSAGADFSLADFHDRVLALGSLPLVTLRRAMQKGGTR